MTPTAPSTDEVRSGIARTDGHWRTVLDGLTDDAVRAPSHLPDWTRGHVLAHMVGVGSAVARQAEAALVGEVLEFYVGGRPARDRAIEEGAGASAAAHRERLLVTLDRVEQAFAALTGEIILDRPTGYRDKPASALLRLWWREALIHLVDVDLGVDHLSAWDAPFRTHLAEYLAPRVPAGVRVDVQAWDDDEEHHLGGGVPVVVRGAANDVFAWLAGRDHRGPVVAEQGGDDVALPDLGPWP